MELHEYRLPPPEPAPADGEDDGRDTESPDKEVDPNVPAWMDGFVGVPEDEEAEGEWVVDERYEDRKQGHPVRPIAVG